MNPSGRCLRALVFAIAVSSAGSLAWAQALSDEQLFDAGITAYHGRQYPNAVKYLFAYQQRSPRAIQDDPGFAGQVSTAITFAEEEIASAFRERDRLRQQVAAQTETQGVGSSVSGLTRPPPPLERPARPTVRPTAGGAAAWKMGLVTTIRIESASYGLNCGAIAGNVTGQVAAACDKRATCDYTVNYKVIGDPVPGCAKDFRISYVCGQAGMVKGATAAPEAGFGSVVSLVCP